MTTAALYLRSSKDRSDMSPAAQRRMLQELAQAKGYTIVADLGDQYSDLEGGDAGYQVKIPNPMYYLP